MIIYKFFVAIVWNDSVRNCIFFRAEDSGSERHGNGGYALITCERQVKDWKAFAEKRTHAQRRNKSGARGSNLRGGGWASAVAWSAHARHFFVRQRALAFQTRTLFKQAGVAREKKNGEIFIQSNLQDSIPTWNEDNFFISEKHSSYRI